MRVSVGGRRRRARPGAAWAAASAARARRWADSSTGANSRNACATRRNRSPTATRSSGTRPTRAWNSSAADPASRRCRARSGAGRRPAPPPARLPADGVRPTGGRPPDRQGSGRPRPAGSSRWGSSPRQRTGHAIVGRGVGIGRRPGGAGQQRRLAPRCRLWPWTSRGRHRRGPARPAGSRARDRAGIRDPAGALQARSGGPTASIA